MNIIVDAGVKVGASDIEASAVFTDWKKSVDEWDIPHVTVHNVVTNREGEILIIQLSALNNGVNYALLLRQESVDILTVLFCGDDRYVLHVTQPRIALGERVRSNAAGMIEHGETPFDAAMREAGEETTLALRGELVNLNERAFGSAISMAVSPGATNERVFFFVREVTVTPEQLKELIGTKTGLAHEDERIVLDVTKFETSIVEVMASLPEAGTPDMKFALSIALYFMYIEGWAT